MNAATKSPAISSLMALCFSSSKRRALLEWSRASLDLQGMLDDLSRCARHIRGFPHKVILIGAEEVDERTFLFGVERGADSHLLVHGVLRVDENLLHTLRRLKGSGCPIGVRRLLRSFLPDDRKFLGGDDCRGELAALQLALVGALEGGADGTDSVRAQHLEL
jgi:hypothetical protein